MIEIQGWLGEISTAPARPQDGAGDDWWAALAVFDRLSGDQDRAGTDGGTMSMFDMAAAIGIPVVRATPAQIGAQLFRSAPGSHAVVHVDLHTVDHDGNPTTTTHAFNAYSDGHRVYALDGPSGRIQPWPPNFDTADQQATAWYVHDQPSVHKTIAPGRKLKPERRPPARNNSDLPLSGMDVVEKFESESGVEDELLHYIKGVVRREAGEKALENSEQQLSNLYSDKSVKPKVSGMLRSGRTISKVYQLELGRTLTLDLRLDGVSEDSVQHFKEDIPAYEFEHSSELTHVSSHIADSRMTYRGGLEANATADHVTESAGFYVSKANEWASRENHAYRQISGGQTTEPGTRFQGTPRAIITYQVSGSAEPSRDRKIDHAVGYWTRVVVPTRDVIGHVERADFDATRDTHDGLSSGVAPLRGPSRVLSTHALSGSDVVTNVWLPAVDATGPQPVSVTDFVSSPPMKAAFQKAYGTRYAATAEKEVSGWLTVELLQAGFHEQTNKQPLILHFESVPGCWMEVHAFVDSISPVPANRARAESGEPAGWMMLPTGQTEKTEFHYGTEVDTSQVRQNVSTWSVQMPLPGAARGDGGTDTGEVAAGFDFTVTPERTQELTLSRQFRTRSTLKNQVPGQSWHGRALLRFEMHTPGAVSPSRLGAPFKGAVHETRERFDVLMEKRETPTDYRGQEVWAPPKRVWGGGPPAERNSVARSPWWQLGTGRRTVQDDARRVPGEPPQAPRPAYAPTPPAVPRDGIVPLSGLGGMDRVTGLDLGGFRGMLDSMGHRAFGSAWKDVRGRVMSTKHLAEVRAALPSMTQQSPLIRTQLSGPGSSTKETLNANIEQLTFRKVFTPLASPSFEVTKGSATTTTRNRQVITQGALGGRDDISSGTVMGEVLFGRTKTTRHGERNRRQQRAVAAAKFDQEMAIFDGWVRLDASMIGSTATVHESGLFALEIAIPLTELQGSRIHDSQLPPTFTRDQPTGFIDYPSTKPAPDTEPKASGPRAATAQSERDGGGQAAGAPGPSTAHSDAIERVASVTSEPSGSPRSVDSQLHWTPPEITTAPQLPAHALLGRWHLSDMVAIDQTSGLLEAIRRQLASALGAALDDATPGLSNQFGPHVLVPRLIHESRGEWIYEFAVPGSGRITVKVRAERQPGAEYVGRSEKFETDLSIEEQISVARIHDEVLRRIWTWRLRFPVPHGSVTGAVTHSASLAKKDVPVANVDQGASQLTDASGLNTTGETEHRTPLRVKTVGRRELFRQGINFHISSERHGLAKLFSGVPMTPESIQLSGVFAYPDQTVTFVSAGHPHLPLHIDEVVDAVRPHYPLNPDGTVGKRGDYGNLRSPDEDPLAAHILDSMTAVGTEVFGGEWLEVRAELAPVLETMTVQRRIGGYFGGRTTKIDLKKVSGTVVLGAHADTVEVADTKNDSEFYSGGQQTQTAGVSTTKASNWVGSLQLLSDALPSGDAVNLSLLTRVDGGLGNETLTTRTETAGTGLFFRKKTKSLRYAGTATIEAQMSRPGGRSGLGTAQVAFTTVKPVVPDARDGQIYTPREGIIRGADQHPRGDPQHGRGANAASTGLPERGLSHESILRITDFEDFRARTSENLSRLPVSSIGRQVSEALEDTSLARQLPAMTRGRPVELFRHGSLRITGEADVQKLVFRAIEPDSGSANVLNEVNLIRLTQSTQTDEVAVRLLGGPRSRLSSAAVYVLAGFGIGRRRRVGMSVGDGAKVSANGKFAVKYANFDGTTRITLTVHDGDKHHVLPGEDVHGPILIPQVETHPVDPALQLNLPGPRFDDVLKAFGIGEASEVSPAPADPRAGQASGDVSSLHPEIRYRDVRGKLVETDWQSARLRKHVAAPPDNDPVVKVLTRRPNAPKGGQPATTHPAGAPIARAAHRTAPTSPPHISRHPPPRLETISEEDEPIPPRTSETPSFRGDSSARPTQDALSESSSHEANDGVSIAERRGGRSNAEQDDLTTTPAAAAVRTVELNVTKHTGEAPRTEGPNDGQPHDDSSTHPGMDGDRAGSAGTTRSAPHPAQRTRARMVGNPLPHADIGDTRVTVPAPDLGTPASNSLVTDTGDAPRPTVAQPTRGAPQPPSAEQPLATTTLGSPSPTWEANLQPPVDTAAPERVWLSDTVAGVASSARIPGLPVAGIPQPHANSPGTPAPEGIGMGMHSEDTTAPPHADNEAVRNRAWLHPR